ncbi:carbohydrate kinase family protein [Paenibacillus thalictri]|uniref:Carbohydrate kinase family protein n=1 Tax=Paenibacillus thalictri TaxID=2527873 RepID=A0A4Q9DPV6_9BACL|nr:carbohydrate kinase family protein [Paenibacillus thalictri]TBL76358.1 carbohydrate kinase family protein [Paenibacillus thalictri]
MSGPAEILVAGHISLDLRPELRNGLAALHPGRLVPVGPMFATCGGAVFNTGVALHRLGIRTRLAGKLGQDMFGSVALKLIAEFGEDLADSIIVAADGRTSYSIILDSMVEDRMILHDPGANATFALDDVPLHKLEGVKLLHFGYPPLLRRFYQDGGAQMAALFKKAHSSGVATSLDMALVEPDTEAGLVDWRLYLERVLPEVDVFLPSFEEIFFMLRRERYLEFRRQNLRAVDALIDGCFLGELADELLSYGAAVVGIKLGERGLYVRTASVPGKLSFLAKATGIDAEAWAGRELLAPCYVVPINGTTGAGDATIAGFLAGLLHGESAEEAAISAVAAGACSVSGKDAVSAIPAWSELKRMMQTMERNAGSLTWPGWRMEPGENVWRGPFCRGSF